MEWTMFAEKEPPFNTLLLVFRYSQGRYTVAHLRLSEIGDKIWFTQGRFWMRVKDTDYWMELPRAPSHYHNRRNPISTVFIPNGGEIRPYDKSMKGYNKRKRHEAENIEKYGREQVLLTPDYIQLSLFK